MDPMIPVVVSILGLVAALGGALAALHLLYAHSSQERDAWAMERWELNTRIQAPQVAPLIPRPLLASERPAEPTPDQLAEEAAAAKGYGEVGTVIGV